MLKASKRETRPKIRFPRPSQEGPEGPRKTTGLIGRKCKRREAFSEAVLIVREAWPYSSIAVFGPQGPVAAETLKRFSLENAIISRLRGSGAIGERSIPAFKFLREADGTGDNSGRETPVPIPNTAVKPVRADGTNAQLGVGRVGRCRSH